MLSHSYNSQQTATEKESSSAETTTEIISDREIGSERDLIVKRVCSIKQNLQD